MRKTLIAGVFFLMMGFCRLNAQNLSYSNWKTYFGDPINDTIVWHILKDTSFVLGKSGDTLVLSHCRISGDTLVLSDFGGMYQCPQSDGVYRVSIQGDNLHFDLVTDGCEGRSVIKDLVWTRVPDDNKSKKGKSK
ncbi:MAG TPA: hypothetical protein VMH01_06245 [Puia sp.]|nr:hypothetical protein [Puia sp.]